MKVSIIIITRNRCLLLSKCLQPLINQVSQLDTVEVIIIDNNSSDNTIESLKKITIENTKFKYYVENKIGASDARNTGISYSVGEWLCFLDDDGIPDGDFVDKLLFTISNYEFDGFGGMWYPYADGKVPKWIPKEVTTMRLLTKEIKVLPKGTTVAAGICAFKRTVVLNAGCFPTQIGPKNGKMGYGEEDFLQNKIWKAGGIIGFNPFWSMKHYVADYKFNLSWNLKRYYLKGRDSASYLLDVSPFKKIIVLIKILIIPAYLLIKNIPRVFFDKNYFWQQLVLDCFKFSYSEFGRLISKKKYIND